MTAELKPTPLRVIDGEQMRKEFATLEARRAVLTEHGQKLLARIRPSSKYYGQGQGDALFAVCIGQSGEYSVLGGPGGQYRLSDVDLFAVFEDGKPPTQITFL
ncbi:hypothetical protein [Hydrogenophaga sp.]|uniref:hypothetical protein n=1 Tax=Hydrogenophaga sp. TaxID=1904254 RepID=UPI0026359861|nr:hypothetical protein [Hydrogenophaga sp.]